MAFDETLANRLRETFFIQKNNVIEKNMFGGLTFMYKGKMCCGIVKDELIVRVIDRKIEEVLDQPYVREMDFTNRPMKGFVFVEKEAFKSELELKNWVELGIEHVEKQLRK